MLSLWSNYETLETWQSQHLRPKLCLLFIVWLVLPRLPSSSTSTTGNSNAVITTSGSTTAIQSPPSTVLPLGAASPEGVHMEGRNDSPLTAVYEPTLNQKKVAAPAVVRKLSPADPIAPQPVVANNNNNNNNNNNDTSQQLPIQPSPSPSLPLSLSQEIRTPPLSPPPSSPSSLSEPSTCAKANTAGQSTCSSSSPLPHLFTSSNPHTTTTTTIAAINEAQLATTIHELGLFLLPFLSPLITPFLIFSLTLTTLLSFQLLSMTLEDHLLRIKMAQSTLERGGGSANWGRGDTWGKKVSRLKWRIGREWKVFGAVWCGLGVVGGVVGWIVREGVVCEGKGGGWREVPFGRWVVGEAGVVQSGGRRMLFRELILIECLTTFLSLLSPLSHLLPSLLPSTLPCPTFLHIPSQTSTIPPNLHLSTSYLLTNTLSTLLTTLSLLQLILQLLHLPSFSPFSLPPHILFHAIRSRMLKLGEIRKGLERCVGCLEVVFREFPEEEEEREGKDEKTEEEWVCCICFEGREEVMEAVVVGGGKTIKARCRLPCGHRYHAICLTQWFHHQNFCPVCHQTVSSSSSSTTSSYSSTTSNRPMFAPPPLVEDLSDIYPGNLRGRGVGGRRRVVLMPMDDPVRTTMGMGF